MGTVQKGLLQRGDQDNYDGTLAATRINSSGGNTSGLKVGNEVDVLSVFGGGDTSNMTRATIDLAISTLGTQNVGLVFAPGTWTIDDDLTIASNFTCVFPAGCVFDVASSKTVTVQGVFFRQHGTYSSGSGTFTISGTDLLASNSNVTEYSSDTGGADAYEITPSPAIASYEEGQMFAFKAANGNTGASTINVNTKGAKTIKRINGNGLSPGDIIANAIHHIRYDGSNFQLIGSWFLSLADDTSPQLGGTLDTNSQQVRFSKGADVASANALTLGTDGNYFDITGTTAITSIASLGVGTVIKLHFDGALTLTHHATDLVLPDGASITTSAGDEFEFVEYATGDWRMTSRLLASATQAEQETGTSSTVFVTPSNQQSHQSAAKCWGKITYSAGAPVLSASYNITSITDTSSGVVTVTIATDFSSANYAILTTSLTASNQDLWDVTSQAAGSFVLARYDTGGTGGADPSNGDGLYFVCYGDQ
jgi:hypothetical protein